MIAYTFDVDLKKNINEREENYWEVYIREIMDLMGVKGDPVSLKDMESPDVMGKYRVLIMGAQSGQCVTQRMKKTLTAWVENGGMLLGFAVENLDNVFGIQTRFRNTQQDDYSVSATFELIPHPLVYGVHPLMFYESKLIILSDFLSVSLNDGIELGRLYDPDGAPRMEPAITWRRIGNGYAGYFAFDAAKTVWLLHQGRPITSVNGEGYEKATSLQVIGERTRKICYADEIVYVLQNLIAQAGHPFIYQIPPDGDKIPDALLYWGGDEYFGPVENSLVSSDWMRSKGLPYHVNIGIERTPGKNDGHPITKEQMRHIMEDNGHEVSLYYMLYEDNNYDITPERIKHQSDLFYKRFGFRPLCTLHYNTSWKGWADPARWMAEAGGKADNSFSSQPCRPYDHPIRNSASYGFGQGTAYPFFFWDDYRHGNERIEFIEEPIACYEIGHRTLGRAVKDPLALMPQDVHLPLDRAIEYHQVINMFYHQVSVATRAPVRAAIEEILRYIEYREADVLHMANNQVAEWWFARSSSEIRDIIADPGGATFTVSSGYPAGLIVKLLIPQGKVCDSVTSGKKNPVQKIRHEFGSDWIYLMVPSGKHRVSISFKDKP